MPQEVMILGRTSENKALKEQIKQLQTREQALKLRLEYGRVHTIPIDRICANPAQPRKNFEDGAIMRLADSLKQYGMLQPLSVRRIMDEGHFEGGLFQLVAGERRLRAATLIGMTHVPCLIINADSKKSAELAIIENIQRENLNMFEQANAIAALIRIYDMTQEQIAERLSCSQSYIANKLRILRLSAKERDIIMKNKLTERHARAVLRITDSDKRYEALSQVAARSMNVAATEEFIDRMLSSEKNVHGKRKGVIRDLRLFYNSIDKAVNCLKNAGITAVTRKSDNEKEITLTITIKQP